MKAKEILNLCESEALTSDEAASLATSYFKKKFKSIGAEIVLIPSRGERALFKFSFPLSRQSFDFLEQYAVRLLNTINEKNITGELVRAAGSVSLSIYVPHSSYDKKRYSGSLFTIGVGRNGDDVNEIFVFVEFSYLFRERKDRKVLSDYTEFSSESGLKKVYVVIDSIAKAIRLTEIGTDSER